MDNSEISDFMSALDEFLQARFQYRTKLSIKGLGPTISVSRHSVHLYLRFKPKHYAIDLDRPLVIAGMRFHHAKQGHGTALLAFIVEHAQKFDLGTVVLESMNEDSVAFAKRMGFNIYPASRHTWQTPIESLRIFLSDAHLSV